MGIDKKVLGELKAWAEKHPERGQRVIKLSGRSFTPEDIYQEVKEGTELGRQILAHYANPIED